MFEMAYNSNKYACVYKLAVDEVSMWNHTHYLSIVEESSIVSQSSTP